MNHFRPINRDTGFLMPPSVDEWLPERHLARFVVEVIAGLDLRAMTGSYRGSGEAPYHPRLVLGILVYGYATGVFSSRKLERATYDSVAFRFVAANAHPDHDTIAVFRRRFLPQIEALFVQVLVLAREMGVLKLGTVALDGTKIHANASRHSALSYEHAGKIEAQLKAEAADQADVPDGISIPDKLARREERLAKIAQARATIEARTRERHARAQAEHDARMAERAAKTAATGKKPGGPVPKPAVEGPAPGDQVNLTDADSRIMQTGEPGRHWLQSDLQKPRAAAPNRKCQRHRQDRDPNATNVTPSTKVGRTRDSDRLASVFPERGPTRRKEASDVPGFPPPPAGDADNVSAPCRHALDQAPRGPAPGWRSAITGSLAIVQGFPGRAGDACPERRWQRPRRATPAPSPTARAQRV